jgi:hypothetical protein
MRTLLSLGLLASTAAYAAPAHIPAGHLPPPGSCRVWYPGTPPGHQPPPQACHTAFQVAPVGAWVVEARYPGQSVVHVVQPRPVRVVTTPRPVVRVVIR